MGKRSGSRRRRGSLLSFIAAVGIVLVILVVVVTFTVDPSVVGAAALLG